ncbi:MAG: hypothetical protein JJT82_01065 [Legionellaceae bacterium]|nr:hypothetical protein [Legionellaceae bacterium]
MKKQSALLLVFFILSLPAMAANLNVADWTEDVLRKTLSVSYKLTPAQVNAQKQYYSFEGWASIASFLGNRMVFIRANRISLHPEPLNSATVVGTEEYSGLPCWRVNQSWFIPELNMQIHFSVRVVREENGFYKIMSLDMHKKEAAFAP